ncbi:MAG: hypothetical protein ACRCXY_07615 [Fusobacteriaceae bacterium]
MSEFFLKFLKNSDMSKISIEFNKNLSKKEKDLIIKINDNLNEGRALIKKDENLERDLIKLKDKNLMFYYNESLVGYIPIINGFYCFENVYDIEVSNEYSYSLKEGSVYNRLKLNHILLFKEKNTHKLYQKILKADNNEFVVEMASLRELFSLPEESYTRFYDIEKKILLPAIEDIQRVVKKNITFEKLKNLEYKTAKIYGVKFSVKESKNEKNRLNIHMSRIKDYVKDFQSVYQELEKALNIYGNEYIEDKINIVLANYKDDMDEKLIALLQEKEIPNESVLIDVRKKFVSLFDLHREVLKCIRDLSNRNLDLNLELMSIKFLTKIYFLKNNDTINYREKNIVFRIEYQKNGITNIIISQINSISK